MERFLALPPEKQNSIVDAAMQLFGAVGYKKASVADIAAAAGISKAMVFYYFGSKKDLYLYLLQLASETVKAEVNADFDPATTDFFEKVRMSTNIKMAVLRRYPGIFAFLTGMYYETDPEVEAEIRRMIVQGEAFASNFMMDNLDTHRFKDDVDPHLVLEILTNFAEGYMAKENLRTQEAVDQLLARFYQCLELLRRHLYKEEFLEDTSPK